MFRHVARKRDTYDAQLAPQVGEMELNHRTELVPRLWDTHAAVKMIFWHAAMLMPFLAPFLLLSLLLMLFEFAVISTMAVMLLLYDLCIYKINYKKHVGTAFGFGLTCFLVFVVLIMGLLKHPSTILPFFVVTVGLTAMFVHVVTKQFAFWMAANPRLDRDAAAKWRGLWSTIFEMPVPEECPAIECYRFGMLAVALSLGVAYVPYRFVADQNPFAAGGVFVFAFAASCLVLTSLRDMMTTERREPHEVLPVLWLGLVKWYRYNSHQTRAAGVFQFPTVWTRRVSLRHAVIFFTLLQLALSSSLLVSPGIIQLLPANEKWKREASAFLLNDSLPHLDPEILPEEMQFFEGFIYRTGLAGFNFGRFFDPFNGDSVGKTLWGTAVRIFLLLPLLIVLAAVPCILFFVIYWTMSGRLLHAYWKALEAVDATEAREDYWPWDNRVDRLINSSNKHERNHLYLGRSLYGDYPVLLHRDLLDMHAHILGDPGSGKTSVGFAPLVTQLIARADCSIILFDLKGEEPLFHCAKEEAELAGLPFLHFTNITGRTSHVFNPLLQSNRSELSVNQRTQMILQGLGLEYGEEYGRGFFSAANEMVLKTYLANYGSLRSIRELSRLVQSSRAWKNLGKEQDYQKQARHLGMMLERLASLLPLNLAPGDLAEEKPHLFDHVIDMPSLLHKPQVVYFSLASTLEPTTVGPVARLAIQSLLSEATRLQGKKLRVYCFIDEFQTIFQKSFETIVAQARSAKVPFILANQAMSQLKRDGVGEAIESLTTYKHYFRASDLRTMTYLEGVSGEGVYTGFGSMDGHAGDLHPTGVKLRRFTDLVAGYSYDKTAGVTGDGVGWDGSTLPEGNSPTVGPRLERNSLIEISAAQHTSIVRFTQSSGYTQFSGYLTPIIHEFHIPKSVYDERKDRPFPEEDEKTVTVPVEFPELSDAGPGAAVRGRVLDDEVEVNT